MSYLHSHLLALVVMTSLVASLGQGCGERDPRPTTPRPSGGIQSSDDAQGEGGGPGSSGHAGNEEEGNARGPGGSSQASGGGGASEGSGGAGETSGGAGETSGNARGNGEDDPDLGVPSGLDMRGGGRRSATPAAPATPALPARGLAQSGGSHSPRTLPPPWIGGANAKVVIEEFSNFECPFCIRGSETMKAVLAHYGARIKLVYRHLPLAYQPQAKLAAQAAVCAQAQGRFWDMKALLFDNSRNLSRADLIGYARRLGLDVPRFTRDLDGGACLPRVEADLKEARRRAIEGTPAFFINGEKHEGARPLSEFRDLIDAALKE